MVVDVDHLKSRVREIRELISKSYAGMNLYKKYSMRHLIIVLAEALGSPCVHIAIEDRNATTIRTLSGSNS